MTPTKKASRSVELHLSGTESFLARLRIDPAPEVPHPVITVEEIREVALAENACALCHKPRRWKKFPTCGQCRNAMREQESFKTAAPEPVREVGP